MSVNEAPALKHSPGSRHITRKGIERSVRDRVATFVLDARGVVLTPSVPRHLQFLPVAVVCSFSTVPSYIFSQLKYDHSFTQYIFSSSDDRQNEKEDRQPFISCFYGRLAEAGYPGKSATFGWRMLAHGCMSMKGVYIKMTLPTTRHSIGQLMCFMVQWLKALDG